VVSVASCATGRDADLRKKKTTIVRDAFFKKRKDSTQDQSRPSAGSQKGFSRKREKTESRERLGVLDRIWTSPRFLKRFAESYLSEVEIEPPLGDEERKLLYKVQDLLGQKKRKKVRALIESALKEKVTPVLEFTLGNLLNEQGELANAAEHYRLAVQDYPKFRRAWTNLAELEMRRGRFPEACQAFSRVIRLGGGDGVMFGLLGLARMRTKDFLAAETAFRTAILYSPKSFDWKMGLAESLFRQNRFADAVTLFDSLIRSSPERAELWTAQGEAYVKMGKPLKALQNFQMVEALGKGTPRLLNNLGDLYTNEGLFDEGVESYLLALKRGKETPPSRALRAANFLAGKGEISALRKILQGIQILRKGKLTKEDRRSLLQLKARLALSDGNKEEEAKVLKEMIQMDPMDGQALILLGDYKRRTGDRFQAEEYYQRAIKIKSSSWKAKLHYAEMLVQERKYREAIPFLEEVQNESPREAIRKYLEEVKRRSKAG